MPGFLFERVSSYKPIFYNFHCRLKVFTLSPNVSGLYLLFVLSGYTVQGHRKRFEIRFQALLNICLKERSINPAIVFMQVGFPNVWVILNGRE